jgi:sec-independent protein translocase protein TatC
MALASLPGVPAPPPRPADDEELEDEAGAKMSFLEHLDELRKRLIVSALSLVGGFLVALLFIDRVFGFIMRPLQQVLPHGGRLVYTEPAEAFLLYMKVAALVGLFLAAPIVLWQIWMFVAPGLYAHEKRFALPFVLFSTFFFVCGALFSHYVVFPWAWRFFAQFTTDYMEFMPRIAPTFSLYVRMMLAMGLVFQMPTLVFFLTRVGLVTPRLLVRHTKYAILVIFIVAAVLTPGPDVVSQALMAAPMIALYGLSIVIAWAFAPARGRQSRAAAAERAGPGA